MLADFYIPRLSNDMKLAVQKTFMVHILYRSLDPSKKNGVNIHRIFNALETSTRSKKIPS